MNYDKNTVESFCSANNFFGILMWLKCQHYFFATVEDQSKYFEDQNLSRTQRLGKRGCFAEVSEDFARVKHPIGIEHSLETLHKGKLCRADLHAYVWGLADPYAVLARDGSPQRNRLLE